MTRWLNRWINTNMKGKHERAVEEYGKMSDSERRSYRIKVYNETKSLFKGQNAHIKHRPADPQPKQVRSSRDLDLPPYEKVATKFVLFNGDCIELALKTRSLGYKTALLNMANRSTPGGGVEHGAGAQEENLFRRSDYFRHLNNKVAKYPIASTGGVYSPNVLIVKGSEADHYPILDDQVFINMIAVAAINRPPLERRGGELVLDTSSRDLTREKILTMLSFGAYFQDECLVLSAFGCGAFKNPPRDIARLFKETLMLEAFKDRFKIIAFAIFDDHNARRQHNPQGNVEPFASVFEVPVICQLEGLELDYLSSSKEITEFEDTKAKVVGRLVPVNEPNVQVITEIELTELVPQSTSFSLVNRNFIDLLIGLKSQKPLVVVGDARDEDELMTRSDLFAHTVDSFRESVFIPGVSLIKDQNNIMLEEFTQIDIVSIGEIPENDGEFRERLLKALSVACANGFSTVVFSDFGRRCPERAASVLKDVLDSDQFARRFSKVFIFSHDESFERTFGISFTN